MNEWPASSPDSDPIEKVWRFLKQGLSQRGPWRRLDELEAALQEEYDKLSLDDMRACMTMPVRISWATQY